MTKGQLKAAYKLWAEKYQLYFDPHDLDHSVILTSFDSGATADGYSGTQVCAVTKHKKDKIHMFVYALRSTWKYRDHDDEIDGHGLENYRKIISF